MRYGPFHRKASPTQTDRDALLQALGGEIWGRTPRGSAWPKVQAYLGPLPLDEAGIEFYTAAEPDPGDHPTRAGWTGPRPGVRLDGEFAKITVDVVLIRFEGTS